MDKLIDDIIEWIDRWRDYCGESCTPDCVGGVEKCEQAYDQIVARIKKSEVTEEWIEEKARRLIEGISLNDIQSLEGWKDFIRSLVEEEK